MHSFVFVSVLAAQQALAQGWSKNAHSYSSPANTDNECSSQQASGYDWSGLQPGSFSSYGSNSFSGFSCSNAFNKRDSLSKRAFQDKCISGALDSKPSFSCGDNDSMSIDQYQVSATEDTDIDCEYNMPDGSICKESHSCQSGGSIIQNTQCGGAKGVTFKPCKDSKPGCSIGIHSIGFNCGTASSTSAYSSTSTAAPSTTSSAFTSDIVSASTTSVVSSVETSPVATSSDSVSSSSAVTSDIVSASTTTSEASSAETISASSTSESLLTYAPSTTSSVTSDVVSTAETSSTIFSVISTTTKVLSTYSAPSYNSSTSLSVAGPVTTSSIASYSTSTIYSTSEVTITSCAASVTNCPASSTVIVTSVIAVSTTVCPVTATETPIAYTATNSSLVSPISTASAAGSYPSPSAPGVLPSCLNTWMWETGCSGDNTDTSCFCKDASFITHVMGCISSWAGSDEDTSAAASYLMGICAPYVPQNPAIITACPSTVAPAASSTPVSTFTPAPSTITLYSTAEVTVTSCAESVTDCPAGSTTLVTSSYAVSTSVVVPVAPGPGTTPSSSEVAAVTPPASSTAATTPVTVISYSSSLTVPCVYSTGVSSGLTIPSASEVTQIITTVTVPLIQFTTQTIVVSGTSTESVGLIAPGTSDSPGKIPA